MALISNPQLGNNYLYGGQIKVWEGQDDDDDLDDNGDDIPGFDRDDDDEEARDFGRVVREVKKCFKCSSRAASTGPISGASYNSTGGRGSRGKLTGMPNTLDGVSLLAKNRILVKDEATGVGADANGVWSVKTLGTGSNGVWIRTQDFFKEEKVNASAFLFVQEGTVNEDTGWVLTNDDPFVIGGASGSALTFVQFAAGAGVVAHKDTHKSGGTDAFTATDLLEAIVKRLQESGGPTNLLLGAIPDGQFLKRSGTSIVGAVPADASNVLSAVNKAMTASTTSSDGDQATVTTIAVTPIGDGYVIVGVNGVQYEVGDGVKTKDCYFSGDGGTTARAIADIAAGDTLHWNGSVIGFQLAGTDRIDFNYNVAA